MNKRNIFISPKSNFLYLPKGPLSFSPSILSLKSLDEEDDNSRRDEEKSNHGGDGDAYHQGLGHKLLTVLPSVPPVLTHPAPVMRSDRVSKWDHFAESHNEQPMLQWDLEKGKK